MAPSSSGHTPYQYISTPQELAALAQEVAGESLIAVDTEAASFHRFVDRIYLIQLSTREATAIIDPLTVGDIGPLGAVLADPRVETIFHDADYDLRTLDRDYGVRAQPGIGLAALLEKYLKVTLNKKHQRADWSRRPLTPEMLDYAAMDTRYLPTLRDELRRQLEELGRLTWALEEFARLESLRYTAASANGDSYLRIKGARALPRRGLALLRELVHWRDAVAAELDRAGFRVMPNEALLALAAAPPASREVMKSVPGVSPKLVDQRADELFEAIGRGMAVDEQDLPRFPRGERRASDAAFDKRVEHLKTVRNAAAERLKLDPGVLCPRGALEAVAAAKPASMGDLAKVPDIRKWQIEVLGKDFLKALGN